MTARFTDAVLANGLRVLAVQQGTGPLTEVRLHVPAPVVTPRGVAAQALLTTCLSARYTARRDTVATPAGVAAEFTASSTYRRIHVASACAVGGSATALGLVRDAVSGLSVTAADFAAARDRLRTNVTLNRSLPAVAARLAMLRELFGAHPISNQLPETPELLATDVGDVDRRFRDTIGPAAATLVVVGAADPTASVDAARTALDDWPATAPATATVPLRPLPPLPPLDGGVRVVARPGAAQSQIRLRAPAFAYDDPRYPALLVASGLFGSHPSSRLVRKLREENGYVYGISCYVDPVPGAPMLALDLDTATDTTLPCVAAIGAQMRAASTVPPSAGEFEAAVAYALGSTVTRLAPRAATASAMVELAASDVDPAALFDLPVRLRRLTRDDVAAAAAECLAPQRFAGVIVGDLPATTSVQLTG